MSSSMHAIKIGDDNKATWSTTDIPNIGPEEVLIKVHAAGINRADLVQRSGNYPPPKGASPILGLEVAGEVAELGAQVDSSKVTQGQKVCALLTGGGYAEYAVVHHKLLLPVPKDFSMEMAAALPEVYFTAWLNLFMEANVQQGELALIHAGASGVGTAAIQLCKHFGVDTIATASESKLSNLTELGATHALNRKDPEMFEQIKELSASHGGVDVILDPVAANYLEGNISVLRLHGRMVLIGLMSGREANLNLGRLLIKRLRLIGSTLRSRPVEDKIAIADQLREKVWPLFDSGELKPIIDSSYPIQNTEEAHAKLASNTTTGKLILTL